MCILLIFRLHPLSWLWLGDGRQEKAKSDEAGEGLAEVGFHAPVGAETLERQARGKHVPRASPLFGRPGEPPAWGSRTWERVSAPEKGFLPPE